MAWSLTSSIRPVKSSVKHRTVTKNPRSLPGAYFEEPHQENNFFKASSYLWNSITGMCRILGGFTAATRLQLGGHWLKLYYRSAQGTGNVLKNEDKEELKAGQMRVVTHSVQITFMCGVCLEVHPEEDVARVTICEHHFCRDCLRSYILSKLDEHRYPIFCPVCMTGGLQEPSGEPHPHFNPALIISNGFHHQLSPTLWSRNSVSQKIIIRYCKSYKCHYSLFFSTVASRDVIAS